MKQPLEANYKVVVKGDAKALLLKGEWTAHIADLMRVEKIKRLIVSSYAGWTGGTLSFLRDINFIEKLDLIVPHIADVSVLYELPSLKSLAIEGNKDLIDFGKFGRLEEVALGSWSTQGYKSLFDCSTLQKIVVTGLPEEFLPEFSRFPSLQNLSLTFCKFIDLKRLGELPLLTRFSLIACRRLCDLAGLEKVSRVVVLWIEQAPSLFNIDAVSSLMQLRTIILRDCPKLSSITPLAGLSALETVGLMQTTKIKDGDLAPLTTLPALRHATFVDRNHYSHRNDEFPKLLPVFY